MAKYDAKIVFDKSCSTLINDNLTKHSLIYESIEQLLEIIDDKPNIITVDTFFFAFSFNEKTKYLRNIRLLA